MSTQDRIDRCMNSPSQPAKISRQYAEQVVAGEILASRWVQRASQRQLDDLAKFKGKASPYLFNPKLKDNDGRNFQPADNLCAFIERWPHVKGPLAGEPIHLEPWQAFILSTVFGWVKPSRKFQLLSGKEIGSGSWAGQAEHCVLDVSAISPPPSTLGCWFVACLAVSCLCLPTAARGWRSIRITEVRLWDKAYHI